MSIAGDVFDENGLIIFRFPKNIHIEVKRMINVASEGKVSVVAVEGDHLDSSNYKQIKAEIQPYIGEGVRIVLDIGTLKFIDSSGLGVFLSLLRDLQGRKGSLRICGPTPAVKILFELVRLEKIIDIFPSRDEAVKSLK